MGKHGAGRGGDGNGGGVFTLFFLLIATALVLYVLNGLDII